MRNKVPQPVQNLIQRRLTDIAVAATAPVIGAGAWLSGGCRLRTLGSRLCLGGWVRLRFLGLEGNGQN